MEDIIQIGKKSSRGIKEKLPSQIFARLSMVQSTFILYSCVRPETRSAMKSQMIRAADTVAAGRTRENERLSVWQCRTYRT